MITNTEKRFFDLVEGHNGLYRRFDSGDWQILLNSEWMDLIENQRVELEKEYQIYKDKEYQDAFLNAP